MAARVVTWRHTFVRGRLLGVGRAGRHCEAALLATAPARSLPRKGGGNERAVAASRRDAIKVHEGLRAYASPSFHPILSFKNRKPITSKPARSLLSLP